MRRPPFQPIPDATREQIVRDLLAGATQKEAAARNGVSVQTVAAIATVHGIPSVSVAERLRRARAARRPAPPPPAATREPGRRPGIWSGVPDSTDAKRADMARLRQLRQPAPAPPPRMRPTNLKRAGRTRLPSGPNLRKLSPEDRAEITSLWLDGDVPSAIAFKTGLSRDLVKPFVQKLKARGGWYHLVYARRCALCHRWMVALRTHARFHPACVNKIDGARRKRLIEEADHAAE